MNARTTVVPVLALAVGAMFLGAQQEERFMEADGAGTPFGAWSFALDSRTCDEVIALYKDSQFVADYPESNAPVVKVRHVRVGDWKDDNLGRGKWIGLVHNYPASGAPSQLYPGLRPNMWGCVFFTVRKDRARKHYYEGTLFLAGEKEGTILSNAMICRHPAAHGQDVRPEHTTFANKCPQGSSVWLTFKAPSGQLMTTSFTVSDKGLEVDLKQAVGASIKTLAVPLESQEESKFLSDFAKATADEAGAWFPCAETGCCRVWED